MLCFLHWDPFESSYATVGTCFGSPGQILNPRQMVSHQKCWHNVYLELKQVLLQYCYLTKNGLIGDLKYQAQIWIQIWNSLRDSRSLELGFWFCTFYRHADWYSCKHNVYLQARDTKKWEQASSAEILIPVIQTSKIYTKPGLLVLRRTPEYSEY